MLRGAYEWQLDIHCRDDKPTEKSDYQIFSVPKKGERGYYPELVKVSKKINTILQDESVPYLIKRQKDIKNESLELTIGYTKGNIYLTYAIPRGRQTSISPKVVEKITKSKRYR
jgi:hypothetical protein